VSEFFTHIGFAGADHSYSAEECPPRKYGALFYHVFSLDTSAVLSASRAFGV
jgi:hypothetical protein